MVLSHLNPDLHYTEKRDIDNHDIEKKVRIYTGTILNKNIEFVVGNINYKYETKNILYFNIYLLERKNNINFIKIGVYELPKNDLESILDSDGEINVMNMENFIPFVYLEKLLENRE